MKDVVYWVWLLMVMGAHNVKSVQLYHKYENIKKVYEILNSDKGKILSEAQIKRCKNITLEKAKQTVDYCNKSDITIITLDDERYPARLASIYNSPILLFCIGDLSFVDNEVTIAVVGTRKPSKYSIDVASSICENLAKLGVVIVSGFALGIDSVAHGCALCENSKTIAVLGSGIDYKYPSKNYKLKSVIAKNGAVISEHLPGTRPDKTNFPERNRIISGLSLGTLVIEASVISGALITAEHALTQGRDVFCVPPANLFDKRYSGVIKYIREGATPVFSHLDIVYEYYEDLAQKINPENPYGDYALEPTNKFAINTLDESKQEKKNKQDIENKKEQPQIEIPVDELDELQKKIVDILREDSYIADDIAKLAKEEISSVLSALTELEIFGYVTVTSGQRYKIS